MNTVTFVTAKLLADAGFPQPILSFLQRWCTKISAETFERHTIGFPGDKFYIYSDSFDTSGICFMPTATDILKELPGWNLAYTNVFKWIVYWDAPGLAEPIQFSHENPAEAAAQAWFYQHEKAPLCKKCNTPAKRGTALKNILAGSSEWADGDMEGATLTLSGNADLIKCWKCPECGHSWQ